MSYRKLFRISAVVLAALAGMEIDTAWAGTYPSTDEEFARLPRYCYARIKLGADAGGPEWIPKMGVDCWGHLHHYCEGLNLLVREQAAREKTRNNLFMAINDGFDYMWKHAGPGCVLMPEVMVNKGKALLLLNNPIAAAESFRKSMELNQRYIPAYIELADLYTKSGQTDAARTILDYALKVDPKSKLVQRKLDNLAGKKKTPDAKPETDAHNSPEKASAAAKEP